MKKLRTLLEGPFLTNSGYGKHCCQILRILFQDPVFDLHICNLRWGNTPFRTEDTDETKLIHQCINKYALAEQQGQKDYDIHIQITIPNEFNRRGKVCIGVTAGAEVHKISHVWVQKCNEFDLIIVPSQFTKNVFENTIVDWQNNQTGEKGQFRITTPVVV